MKDSQVTDTNIKASSLDLVQNGRFGKSSRVSNLLLTAINRYQFDIVGWTEYCVDNRVLKRKALPIYRQKPLENLRIQDTFLTGLGTPSIKKVYASPKNYIKYLEEEYVRDQAFYEAILKNPGKFKTDNKDILLDKEIDHSAKEYLKTIEKRKIDEEALIECIPNDKWLDVKMSKYPKVQLGLLLGVSKEALVNNFGIYFITLLKGHFAGSRTAFLSSAGPASWYELERLQAELTYFKKEVVNPAVKKLHSTV
jgi:hypothetical protein